MEAEGTMMPSIEEESTNKSFARRQPSKSQFSDDTTSSDARCSSSKPCFDCSICLDFPVDPVVTLCGHLYCWPCIYKWLQNGATQHDCPVCKSPLSQNSLVPLYARGAANQNIATNRKCIEIPNRPAFSRSAMPNRSARQDHYYPPQWGGVGVLNSTAGGILGGLVIALLPLVSRNASSRGGGEMNFTRMNQVIMVGSSERERRVENSLHQIWMFLFWCSVLCWLFF